MKTLDRPFEVIAFDWDGTAVMSRGEDASAVRLRLERLLNLDVRIVIITGTSFPNIDRQVSAAIHGAHKRDLYVCTNRGSEVYGFDAQSRPKLLWRRVATAEEHRELVTTAERLRSWIKGQTGLAAEVIGNRLNRCKIDLIPLPEWRDPPKSAIGELLRAVQDRLKEGGISGGLREVLAVAAQIAGEEGMPEARITSDVKHVEVGLTDKGDSVEWVMRELVAKGGLSAQDVLIAGDEFGPLDGFPGSDYMMVRPAMRGATCVSVGKEPNGVPPGVIHVGGGPTRFRALLDEQIAEHEKRAAPAEPAVAEDGWRMIETGFNAAREHEIESIFSSGNGYLGTRGSLAEGVASSRPATFVAGVFELKPGSTAVPQLAKAPDWARLRVFVAGEELRLDQGEWLEHRRTLDLQRGMLLRGWRHSDAVGRITRLSYLRFASLADRHAAVEAVTIMPENYGGVIAVESVLDGSITSPDGGGYLAPEAVANEPVLAMRALGSGVQLAFAMASTLQPTLRGPAEPTTTRDEASITQRWEWPAELGQEYRVEKLVAVYTSRDLSDPVGAATEHLTQLRAQGMAAIRHAHEEAWAERWRAADIEIVGDVNEQRAIRFAIYHLIAAANPEDDGVSIGARGLTGEAYKGHVFWDTETFMLPFYTFTDPPTARTLLRYRHHTLPASRERAKAKGYRGALYAWESTSTGEDVTPSLVLTPDGEVIRILSGEMEHHISADVAYAVWQYWQATGDDRFLREAGAEIILETARFWASRARLEADGRYHIRRVIGPDEYHEGVDDNAYTNVMAQWNLEQGAATAELLEQRWPKQWAVLAERLELARNEAAEWSAMAAALHTGFDPATGLFEQFAGFFDLEYVDLKAYEPRTAPLDVILGRQRTEKTQIIKQADVVMLLHLLWDRFPPEVRAANFRYYEPRCDHGSSLSPAIHALVAARLGDVRLAERYFRQAADIDLANNMGNAAGGVHMAAQGGLWQAVAFGFAGMRRREDGLGFDLHLAPSWRCVRVPLHWRGRRLRLTGRRERLRVDVTLESGEPMCVAFGEGRPRLIEPGKPGAAGRWYRPGHEKEMA